MSPKHSTMDPEHSPIWESDTNVPYANRSIGSIIFFVVLVAGAIGFLIFWFSGDGTYDETTPESKTVASGGGDKDESLSEDLAGFIGDLTGNSTMTTGEAARVLEEGAQKQAQAQAMNQMQTQSGQPAAQMQKNAQGQDGTSQSLNIQNVVYEHSVADMMGQDIYDKDGNIAGEVHDILVHKETGEAKAVIANKEGISYQRKLKNLSFDTILKQETSGETHLLITDNMVEQGPEFEYKKDSPYVSLRHLKDGQVLDYDGKVAGTVSTIIYENAQAQSLYFQLKPKLSPDYEPKAFQLDFDEMNIVQNPDGYDIQLTKAQTEKIAEMLYRDDPEQETQASAAMTNEEKQAKENK